MAYIQHRIFLKVIFVVSVPSIIIILWDLSHLNGDLQASSHSLSLQRVAGVLDHSDIGVANDDEDWGGNDVGTLLNDLSSNSFHRRFANILGNDRETYAEQTSAQMAPTNAIVDEIATVPDSTPEFVVILAQMRTGSSVLGQIFNQNKRVFFLYEPLYVIRDWERSGIRKTSEEGSLETAVLRNISRCRFSRDFIRSLGSWGARSKSNGILPLCKHKRVCTELHPKDFLRVCSSFRGRIALKVIRAELKHLRPLIEQDGVNVKIIHLVRDPRGTANSRYDYYIEKGIIGTDNRTLISEKVSKATYLPGDPGNHGRSHYLNLTDNQDVFQNPQVLRSMHTACRWMTDIVRTARSRPAWLQGRYLLVRYEDFADNPIKMTHDVYRFLGRLTPPEVETWVRENTMGSSAGKSNAKNHLFNTSKNATAVASRWRERLSRDQVLAIQEVCGEAMDLLGYSPMGPGVDLSDLSIPLIQPLRHGSVV